MVLFRGMGSLGYMLAGMAVGFLVCIFLVLMESIVCNIMSVLLILAFSISFGFPKDDGKKEDGEEVKVKKGSFKELLTNKNFLFILFFTTI